MAVPTTHTAFLTSCVLAYVPTVYGNPLPPPSGYVMKFLDNGSRFVETSVFVYQNTWRHGWVDLGDVWCQCGTFWMTVANQNKVRSHVINSTSRRGQNKQGDLSKHLDTTAEVRQDLLHLVPPFHTPTLHWMNASFLHARALFHTFSTLGTVTMSQQFSFSEERGSISCRMLGMFYRPTRHHAPQDGIPNIRTGQ